MPQVRLKNPDGTDDDSKTWSKMEEVRRGVSSGQRGAKGVPSCEHGNGQEKTTIIWEKAGKP